MGCDTLVKLPKIYHNTGYINSNNKTSYKEDKEDVKINNKIKDITIFDKKSDNVFIKK